MKHLRAYLCFEFFSILDIVEMAHMRDIDFWNEQILDDPSLTCDIVYMLDNLKIIIDGKKGRDLTQSYDKSPYTNKNVKRAK